MSKIIINSEKAPKAIGPYNQAILCGNFVFCSGQLPVLPATGNLIDGGIKEQTAQVLKNIEAVLGEVNLTLESVIQTTVYLTDINNFNCFNEVFGEYFKEWKPTRTTVAVKALPKNSLVEITAVAYKE